ncbi:MAG: hypothetical protein P1V20_19575 [Verrucomicrobiales bacterium]|nr:hypothetical protein [Verrucomicrobiales bacterium]
MQFQVTGDNDSKYKKYQWIEAELENAPTDKRPETYRVKNRDEIKLIGDPIPTGGDWSQRRKHFIDKVPIHTDLSKLIEAAHKNELSLAIFKPSKWLKFDIEAEKNREWDSKKLDKLEADRQQLDLFKDEAKVQEDFKVVKKLPYKFRYQFETEDGKTPRLLIEDWEIGALYWNCLRNANGDEKVAVEKVKQKYWDEFVNKASLNTHLILGTTLEHHNKKAPNPFVIIGVLPLPGAYQPTLL